MTIFKRTYTIFNSPSTQIIYTIPLQNNDDRIAVEPRNNDDGIAMGMRISTQNAPRNSNGITIGQEDDDEPFKFSPIVIPSPDDHLLENLLSTTSGALDFLEHTIPYDSSIPRTFVEQYEESIADTSRQKKTN